MSEPAPRMCDTRIGIHASGMRQETDSMGGINLPANRYWGAQTERPPFRIGERPL